MTRRSLVLLEAIRKVKLLIADVATVVIGVAVAIEAPGRAQEAVAGTAETVARGALMVVQCI